jgi:hypothetical protein
LALTILDQNKVGSVLTAMWKKHLGTSKDPANGKWYTDGANHDGRGLYGGLTDIIDQNATFDEANKKYTPTQRLAASSVVDNRNGLVGNTTVTLAYQYTDTVSTTHTTSNSVKVGVGVDFKAKAEIFGIGGEATTKFSLDYTYTSTDASTSTQTRSQTVTQNVAVNVPAGKVYKAVLVATSQQLDIPYKVNVRVSGITETWFEDRVNGHYNWMMDIGSAFAFAGDPSYQSAGNGQGIAVAMSGTLTAQQSTDFVVEIWDITSQYNKAANSALENLAAAVGQRAAAPANDSLMPPGAILISRTPVNTPAEVLA